MGTSKEEIEARGSKVVLAGSLFAAGLLINMTLYLSWSSRYFWVENSGVEEGSPDFSHLIALNPSERGLLGFGALLMGLGLILFIWRMTHMRSFNDRS